MSKGNLKEAIRFNQRINKLNTNIKTASEKEAERSKKYKKSKAEYTFMGFAVGEDSVDEERTQFKHYKGVATVSIAAFNPNKKELEELFNRPQQEEPQYISQITVNDKPVRRATIKFYLRIDKEKHGVDTLIPVTFNIDKLYMTSQNGKICVIDKVNRTCWLTPEEYKSRAIPMFNNGTMAQIDASSYRPMFRGEDVLNKMLAAYVGIPDLRQWNPTKQVFETNPNLDECACRLEHPEKLFDGDFSEIKEIINSKVKKDAPVQRFKAMIGVRMGDNGRQYHDVFKDCFLKYRSYPKRATGLYSDMDYELTRRQADGRYPNTEFYAGELTEYVNTPSNIEQNTEKTVPTIVDDPLGGIPTTTMPDTFDDLPF